MSKKGKCVEPRVYSSLNGGVFYEALQGNKWAEKEIKNINCFVPLEDYNNVVYATYFLFYIGRLS